MAFDHLRADPSTADRLLLGAQQVRETMVQIPDLVEHFHLNIGVDTQVADQRADVGPVLLFDVGAVVLVPRPRPGERDLVCLSVFQQVRVDELHSVVGIDPEDRERNSPGAYSIAANTWIAALFRTNRLIVQPVAMSVIVSVKQNSPKLFPPSWPTRSISTNPGTVIPFRPSPDWDLVFQQRPGFGV